jgi:hypothetical protein
MNAIKEIAELGLKRLTPYVRECESLKNGDIMFYTFLQEANLMYFEVYKNGNALPVTTPIDIAVVWAINKKPDLAKMFRDSTDSLLEYGFTDEVLKEFLDYYLTLFQI